MYCSDLLKKGLHYGSGKWVLSGSEPVLTGSTSPVGEARGCDQGHLGC